MSKRDLIYRIIANIFICIITILFFGGAILYCMDEMVASGEENSLKGTLFWGLILTLLAVKMIYILQAFPINPKEGGK